MEDTVIPPFTISNISSTNGFFSENDNTLTFIIPRIGDIADNFNVNCNMNNILSYKTTYHQSPDKTQLANRFNRIFTEQVIDKKVIEYEIMAKGSGISFGFNTSILVPPILFSKLYPSAIITISVTFVQGFILKDVSSVRLTFRYRQYDIEAEQDKIMELSSLTRIYSNFEQHQYFLIQITPSQIDSSGVQNIFLPFINFISRLVVRLDDSTIKVKLLYKNKNRTIKDGLIEINENITTTPLQLSVITQNPFRMRVFGYSSNVLIYENGFVSTGFPSIFMSDIKV